MSCHRYMDHLCENCGIRPKHYAYTNKKTGKRIYKRNCVTCNKYKDLRDKAKQTHCGICQKQWHFVQLDVDHCNPGAGDGYENLQVICSNCHRLKTYMSKENGPKPKGRRRKK